MRHVEDCLLRLVPGRPQDPRHHHRRGPRPRRLRAAAGQGRVGGRRAAGGLRHHHPRLRGLGPRVGPRARVRRALDRGHVLPPRPGHGQRHRLRLDRRRRFARDDAALDRQHRSDHARRARAARHGRRGHATSTPPTSPARCRSTAASPRCSATSTTSSSTPSRPASRPSARACRSSPPTTPRWRSSPTASPTSGCCRSRPRRRSTRSRRSTRAGRCTARRTCSAWTCTTAVAPRPTSTPRATSPRGWSSPSSPASTSRRTTSSSPRSCAASASGSRTTSSSRPTAGETSRPPSPAPPRRSRSGWARCVRGFVTVAARPPRTTGPGVSPLRRVPLPLVLAAGGPASPAAHRQGGARALARALRPPGCRRSRGRTPGFRNKAKMAVGGTVAAPTLGILDRAAPASTCATAACTPPG